MQVQQPRLSFWQIWNVSFGFLGVQFGFALQNANVSRILSDLGSDLHSLSLFWHFVFVVHIFFVSFFGCLMYFVMHICNENWCFAFRHDLGISQFLTNGEMKCGSFFCYLSTLTSTSTWMWMSASTSTSSSTLMSTWRRLSTFIDFDCSQNL